MRHVKGPAHCEEQSCRHGKVGMAKAKVQQQLTCRLTTGRRNQERISLRPIGLTQRLSMPNTLKPSLLVPMPMPEGWRSSCKVMKTSSPRPLLCHCGCLHSGEAMHTVLLDWRHATARGETTADT